MDGRGYIRRLEGMREAAKEPPKSERRRPVNDFMAEILRELYSEAITVIPEIEPQAEGAADTEDRQQD